MTCSDISKTGCKILPLREISMHLSTKPQLKSPDVPRGVPRLRDLIGRQNVHGSPAPHVTSVWIGSVQCLRAGKWEYAPNGVKKLKILVHGELHVEVVRHAYHRRDVRKEETASYMAAIAHQYAVGAEKLCLFSLVTKAILTHGLRMYGVSCQIRSLLLVLKGV
mmetsp:Transcript_63044/g.111973  ORF Transcript_63044/g.111973 Transcript_63044/m.111973 type:complete len:164 (+) Transcript_63044:227-718(+)